MLAYLPAAPGAAAGVPGGAETMTVAYRWRGRWIMPSKRRLDDEFPGRVVSHWQPLPGMPGEG